MSTDNSTLRSKAVAASTEVPGDWRMAKRLWPFLLASTVSLIPFTVFGMYLVPIAAAADGKVAEIGGLRGLGGLAALVVGVAVAPLIDRLARELVAAGGLALLGISAALGAIGNVFALAAFCLLIGASTSILGPSIGAAAADRFTSPAAAGRAATLVSATTSMMAMLAAPVLAVPGMVWGWRGNLLAASAISLVLSAAFFWRGRGRTAPVRADGGRPGYVATYRALARIPGALPLLAVALLRTAAFMGYLAYLAAFYDDRFALAPGWFALVWSLSGASFFVGNLFAGRYLALERPWIGPEKLLVLGVGVALVSVTAFYFSPTLPSTLVLTALMGASHATVAACVTTLLVRRSGDLRGSALGINAAGMSLGVFLGAAVGGLGLGLGGYPGTALAFASITLVALVFAFRVRG
ncbi:putative MFS family arabinose efflux permease [Kribbella voronezhensis]|uniref:Putative MFS family arabinose efflux permease n=1 Tax=Kribbella voronezhensis TaxID=2512212 RepID=A0A4R7TIB1_9ACTN|nr:MFS transporter [Kribbella voronezhensis]TDU91308.1 putative MFS family arabinose efflux permease [Kribbella voronezhensis]